MLFTNPRQINKTPQAPNKTVHFPIMGISRQYKPVSTPTSIIPASIPLNPAIVKKPIIKTNLPENPKPIKWGAPTWFLFHTLAEKIKESEFPRLRKELLDIIYNICINLPCPICSKHATEYLKGINFNAIETKSQLKQMLFHFHNSVNMRKGLPLFTLSELDAKYAASNTGAIITYFMQHFQNKSYNIRLIADELHRKKLMNQLNTWLSAHIYAFD